MTTRRTLLKAALPLALGPAAWPALAQGAYPDRPIRLVVPFPAGALTDMLGRMVSERLRAPLGQPMVVENRPGAGTLLGASAVAKAPADGYHLLVATSTTLAISPAMYATPPAVPADFTGVALLGTVSFLLVTRKDLPVQSLPELVGEMRRQPGQLNFASPGTGTMHHLLVEMLKVQEKVDAAHVPYQGSMAALTDLMTGRIDFMFLDAVAALPQIAAGKIKVIAVASSKRLPALPNVATVMESHPQIDVHAWQAVVAPKGTPAAIVQRLNQEINAAFDTAEGREALLKVGVAATPLGVRAVNELMARDDKRLGDLVRSLGLKAG
jgi:tripartite-type tricarboxylate transporter receptor subunit TctC